MAPLGSGSHDHPPPFCTRCGSEQSRSFCRRVQSWGVGGAHPTPVFSSCDTNLAHALYKRYLTGSNFKTMNPMILGSVFITPLYTKMFLHQCNFCPSDLSPKEIPSFFCEPRTATPLPSAQSFVVVITSAGWLTEDLLPFLPSPPPLFALLQPQTPSPPSVTVIPRKSSRCSAE